MNPLERPLAPILGKPTADRLASTRDLHTVGDLLDFVPRRHVPYETDLQDLVEGEFAVVVADVISTSVHSMAKRRGKMLKVQIGDGSTTLDVSFFSLRGHAAALQPGVRAIWTGKVTAYHTSRGSTLQLTHPDYEVVPEGWSRSWPGLLPLYAATPRVRNSYFMHSVETLLMHLDELPDPIPAEVRAERGLVDRLTAYRLLHRADTRAQLATATARMRFEEALVLQSVLAERRATYAATATRPRVPTPGGLLERFDARLPFELTAGQAQVSAEILTDLARPTPMHRLLQGEVGSGKTLVALRAMLAVVDSGGQAVLLAPTEVLAAQHYRGVRELLGPLAEGGMLGGAADGTRVVLLTGSSSAAARRAALAEIASGAAGIVIGTHALLQDVVEFADLALAVIDEQHRFGVEQRDVLRTKGADLPHLLVMTATPIPRTIAMTVFGDMETSTLTELPVGRAGVTTHALPTRWEPLIDRMWQRVRKEIDAGHQVYVVAPRIDDDGPGDPQGLDLASVESTEAMLAEHPQVAGVRTGVLHGRLPSEAKDQVMRAFAAGELDLLISTTVIEVGVDVPNATVMVILDADRFGISQLHQLRGRIGRGSAPGHCFLVTSAEAPTVVDRLKAVAETTDGFVLAELDTELRREGDILGAAQHGSSSALRYLRVIHDAQIIEDARAVATELYAADPGFTRNPALRRAVDQLAAEDRAAYLERS